MQQTLLAVLALFVATQIAFNNSRTATRGYLNMLRSEVETEAVGVAVSTLDSLRYVPFAGLDDAAMVPWKAYVSGSAVNDTIVFNMSAAVAPRRLDSSGSGYVAGDTSDDYREVTLYVSHQFMSAPLEMRQVYARSTP